METSMEDKMRCFESCGFGSEGSVYDFLDAFNETISNYSFEKEKEFARKERKEILDTFTNCDLSDYLKIYGLFYFLGDREEFQVLSGLYEKFTFPNHAYRHYKNPEVRRRNQPVIYPKKAEIKSFKERTESSNEDSYFALHKIYKLPLEYIYRYYALKYDDEVLSELSEDLRGSDISLAKFMDNRYILKDIKSMNINYPGEEYDDEYSFNRGAEIGGLYVRYILPLVTAKYRYERRKSK